MVDASREHARRRIRDEEEAILSGKFRRSKGKDQQHTRPSAQHRPGSYGALAETAPSTSAPRKPRRHQTSSRSAPATSSDHPAPIGESIVSEVSTLVKSVLPGVSIDEDEDPRRAKRHLRDKLHLPKFGNSKGQGDELPPDAVDLVVEDSEAEEEEMLRQRRRGEPSAKRTRVYRKAYIVPEENGQASARDDGAKGGEGETVQARDVVARDEAKDGAKEQQRGQNDEVQRFTVEDDSATVRQAGIDETPGVDGAHDMNPWE